MPQLGLDEIFNGGQMTDLPSFVGTKFSGDELFEVVSSSNPATAINYSISSLLLARYLGGLIIGSQTLVRTGPTYASVATDTRILCYVDNPSPGPLTITLLPSAQYKAPVLVKDLIGAASSTNPVDVVFSDGELADGLSSIPIRTDYGSYTLNPSPLGGWYLTP